MPTAVHQIGKSKLHLCTVNRFLNRILSLQTDIESNRIMTLSESCTPT